jgi:hypothetical protein
MVNAERRDLGCNEPTNQTPVATAEFTPIRIRRLSPARHSRRQPGTVHGDIPRNPVLKNCHAPDGWTKLGSPEHQWGEKGGYWLAETLHGVLPLQFSSLLRKRAVRRMRSGQSYLLVAPQRPGSPQVPRILRCDKKRKCSRRGGTLRPCRTDHSLASPTARGVPCAILGIV